LPWAARRMGYGRLTAQPYVHFVLIDPATTRVRAAGKLDDRLHAREDRRAIDQFAQAAMHATAPPGPPTARTRSRGP
jgi:hypothetical protein